MEKSILIVDCQNDFISGPLACLNAKNAIDEIIKYLNNNDVVAYYSFDWHSKKNKSFSRFGGIWPDHCIEETYGAKLDSSFFEKVKQKKKLPNNNINLFYKGMNDDIEEYSAFNAINNQSRILSSVIKDEIIICGIASEYCVRETVLDFLKNNYKVTVLESGLAYVDLENHKKNVVDLKEKGVIFI